MPKSATPTTPCTVLQRWKGGGCGEGWSPAQVVLQPQVHPLVLHEKSHNLNIAVLGSHQERRRALAQLSSPKIKGFTWIVLELTRIPGWRKSRVTASGTPNLEKSKKISNDLKYLAAVCKAVIPWLLADEMATPGEETIASHTSWRWCLVVWFFIFINSDFFSMMPGCLNFDFQKFWLWLQPPDCSSESPPMVAIHIHPRLRSISEKSGLLPTAVRVLSGG